MREPPFDSEAFFRAWRSARSPLNWEVPLAIEISTLLLLFVLALACVCLAMLFYLRRRIATVDGLSSRFEALNERLSRVGTTLELLEQRSGQSSVEIAKQLGDTRTQLATSLGENKEHMSRSLGEQRTFAEEQGARAQKSLNDSMQQGFDSLHKQLNETLLRNTTETGQKLEALTRTTEDRLKEIGGQVDKRLTEGFEKTTATFTDVIKRLALIDEAQKKITELSSEVVGLQEILSDKRSRGVFGEVQLAALVRNVMPPESYAFQHRFGNDRIADCVLFLPEPTGTIAIDSKFPLESYRLMTDLERSEIERKQAERQFKQDIRKHIGDIAGRYIIPGTTSDGAIMFVPAEAVFAEIQAHHGDVLQEAHNRHVWLASPTTLWAILNTASSVLKDAATREQVDIIQKHLRYLAEDFQRFRTRMDKLATHIDQANRDVQDVNTSARRITDRFEKIERVELDSDDPEQLTKF